MYRLGAVRSLYVDKVAIHHDIFDKQLGEGDLSEGETSQIQVELNIINKRWETARGGDIDRENMPLLTSKEWTSIQLGAKIS